MKNLRRIALLLLVVPVVALSTATPAAAQSPVLLADLDDTPRTWGYGDVVYLGDRVIAEVSEPYGTTSLVAVDPVAGTHAQLLPNNQLGDVFLRFGELVVFKEQAPQEGTLYVSDGTHRGTEVLGNVPGSLDEEFSVVSNGRLFFWTGTPDGWRLYSTDGTDLERLATDGTSPTGRASRLIPGNGGIFFENGECEIAFSDGTSVGTEGLFTVPETDRDGRQQQCRLFEGPGDRFVVTSAPFLTERAWLSDGTLAGTERADHFGLVQTSRAVGAYLFYIVGDELRVSDGTETGSSVLASPGSRTQLYAVNGRLVAFTQDDSLLVSDGTTEGTEEVAIGLDYLLESVVVDDRWLYFMTDGGALRRTDGTAAGTERNLGIADVANDRRSTFDAIANAVVFLQNDALVHRDLETDETTIAWPRDEIEYTRGSAPGSFRQVGPNVFFQAAAEGWATDGTPGEVTLEPLITYRTEFYGLLDDGLMFARIDDDFVTVRNGDLSTVQPLDDSLAEREFEPSDGFFLETRVFVRDRVAFIVDLVVTFSGDDEIFHRFLVSTVGPNGIETLLSLRLNDSSPDPDSWRAWIDQDGNLEIYLSRDCRHWVVDGTGEILLSEEGNDAECPRVRPTRVGVVDLQVDQLGLYAVFGERRDRLVSSTGLASFTEPLVVGDRAYWVMKEEQRTELWWTDGSPDGTEFISRGLAAPGDQRGLVQAGDAVLYVADEGTEGRMAIRGHRAVGGKFTVTPVEGNGRIDAGATQARPFAVVGETIVYTGRHDYLGQEPFAIEFERLELPEPPADDETEDDGGTGSDEFEDPGDTVVDGCGCGTTSDSGAGSLFLLLLVAVASRWRRRAYRERRPKERSRRAGALPS